MKVMKPTRTDFSVEWEPDKPFTIKWKPTGDSEYELFYKGEPFGIGRAPEELLDTYVEIMNFAYNEGRKMTS